MLGILNNYLLQNTGTGAPLRYNTHRFLSNHLITGVPWMGGPNPTYAGSASDTFRTYASVTKGGSLHFNTCEMKTGDAVSVTIP